MTPAEQEYTKIHTHKDEFEWYRESGDVKHINFVKWADVYLICPLTSNSLNKMIAGICDNIVLTCWKAWDESKPVYIAPAMNTAMLMKDRTALNKIGDSAKILYPTVKKLACGDFGLGALADLGDIINCVEGHRWKMPIGFKLPGIYYKAPIDLTHPGQFGTERKHDIHTGVDLYLQKGYTGDVTPFEHGEVVGMGQYTGEAVGCGWWHDTHYVSVKGKSGVIAYGEIEPDKGLKIGDLVKCETVIGEVIQVLKHPPRIEVFGHSMKMLHVELLIEAKDTRIEPISDAWEKGGERPRHLKDPNVYLMIDSFKSSG